ncbi:hypothetical protein RHMOL_Rhmol04G0030600 [Rhododendron molle]|uniref:Uncharacterized protein n=1 Tax=Rhododendron molle TaxID=49168 RepID=A0ACC0NWK7_RHOML|nr:hypothetical protein RHMOL_Rhmol04G0030600 [Rhododendron molle]
MVSPSASDFVVVMVSTPLLVIKMENNRDNMQRGCFGDGRREASLLSIDTTSDMVGLSAALSCPKPPSPSLFTSEKFSVAADTLEKLNHVIEGCSQQGNGNCKCCDDPFPPHGSTSWCGIQISCISIFEYSL